MSPEMFHTHGNSEVKAKRMRSEAGLCIAECYAEAVDVPGQCGVEAGVYLLRRSLAGAMVILCFKLCVFPCQMMKGTRFGKWQCAAVGEGSIWVGRDRTIRCVRHAERTEIFLEGNVFVIRAMPYPASSNGS